MNYSIILDILQKNINKDLGKLILKYLYINDYEKINILSIHKAFSHNFHRYTVKLKINLMDIDIIFHNYIFFYHINILDYICKNNDINIEKFVSIMKEIAI